MILLGGCLVDEAQIQLVEPCRVDACGEGLRDACAVYLTGGNRVIINASMSEVVAIMEKLGWMTDDAESGGEPFSLNVTERDELRSYIENGFTWIAKELNGAVWAYIREPIFEGGTWGTFDGDLCRRLSGLYEDLPAGADGSVCIEAVLQNDL